jgi:NAD(P)-dependent dehydrogenase (short-subunit alcohol dehydrogenase family)
MPTDTPNRRLVIGHDLDATRELGASLGAEVTEPPDLSNAEDGWDWPWRDALTAWGSELRALPPTDTVAICTWSTPAPAVDLCDLDGEAWRAQVERPLATWFTALSAAAQVCADGGSVVIVAERPAALDSDGRADVLAVADGLVALTRSAALIEGRRRVRFNVVTTELFTAPQILFGMPPPLRAFPGTVGREIAGAVQLLWSPDAAGITGTVVRADCGRAW